MFKQIFFILIFLGIALPIYGQARCPSVEDIRSGIFRGWQPLNANSNARAPYHFIKAFMEQVEAFDQAEYFEDRGLDAHCYYDGFREVYLAKKLPTPEFSPIHWHIHYKRWQCRSSIEHCFFDQ